MAPTPRRLQCFHPRRPRRLAGRGGEAPGISTGPLRVTGVEIQEATADSAIIQIHADQEVVKYNTFMLPDPPRIVIDCEGDAEKRESFLERLASRAISRWTALRCGEDGARYGRQRVGCKHEDVRLHRVPSVA